MSASPARRVRTIPAKWDEILFVCRKCEKKLDGGFGPKRSTRLSKLLGKAFKHGKRRVKVVSVGCLKICPKGAVTLVKGAERASAHLIYIGADMGGVIEELGLGELPAETVIP